MMWSSERNRPVRRAGQKSEYTRCSFDLSATLLSPWYLQGTHGRGWVGDEDDEDSDDDDDDDDGGLVMGE
jgi:hypothetical protein